MVPMQAEQVTLCIVESWHESCSHAVALPQVTEQTIASTAVCCKDRRALLSNLLCSQCSCLDYGDCYSAVLSYERADMHKRDIVRQRDRASQSAK